MMDKRVLGENVIVSSDCNETGVNNNVLVCGSSGCGKTMSISEPCLLETFNSSLIATVTKRRIVDKYKAVFKERGYVVKDLNFISPGKSEVAFDPLAYVSSYRDITYLAEALVNADPRKERTNADPYWDQAATSLLSAEIAYIMMAKKEKATFADVLEFHDSITFREKGGQISTSVDIVFDTLAQKDPGCHAVSCWKTFRQLPISTASCVFSVLNTTIDTIFSPEMRKMMKKKTKVDFQQLATEKTVLFVSTSPVNSALHCFINVFYAQAFKTLFEYAESLPDGKLRIPVHMLCDDFATGSKVNNFPEFISVFREKQISVTLLVQSESQLENIYGSEGATTIIDNCDTYLYMGGMDLKTGHSISERLNVPLEDVLYMPIGQEIVFRRGQKPVVTTRFDILKNKTYQEITKQYEKEVKQKTK